MAKDNDIVAARDTYSGFLTLLKVGTIACVIAAFIVILLIAPK